MTPPGQPSTDGHREIVLRTSADVLEHAAMQAQVLAAEWPEYGDAIRRLERFVNRVSAGAVTVGHQSKVRRPT